MDLNDCQSNISSIDKHVACNISYKIIQRINPKNYCCIQGVRTHKHREKNLESNEWELKTWFWVLPKFKNCRREELRVKNCEICQRLKWMVPYHVWKYDLIDISSWQSLHKFIKCPVNNYCHNKCYEYGNSANHWFKNIELIFEKFQVF